jgi:DNA-binding NarL/FixJ family response regulator
MENDNKIKVVLVDSQCLLIQGLEILLKAQTDIEVVGVITETKCQEMLIQRIVELKPDVVVIDINLQEINAMEVCCNVLGKNPDIKVLALCSYFHQLTIDDAFRTGVAGFILKDSTFDEFTCAIRTVHENKLYTCAKMTDVLAKSCVKQLQKDNGSGSLALNQREYDIIRLFSNGKSSRDIAGELNLSIKTIDACRRRIMNKLDINSMAEFVKYAIRTGITSV